MRGHNVRFRASSSGDYLHIFTFYTLETLKHAKMVLHQPPNQHVMKAFDLTGKVALITGTTHAIWTNISNNLQAELAESD
jgi:hypothetical protein